MPDFEIVQILRSFRRNSVVFSGIPHYSHHLKWSRTQSLAKVILDEPQVDVEGAEVEQVLVEVEGVYILGLERMLGEILRFREVGLSLLAGHIVE